MNLAPVGCQWCDGVAAPVVDAARQAGMRRALLLQHHAHAEPGVQQRGRHAGRRRLPARLHLRAAAGEPAQPPLDAAVRVEFPRRPAVRWAALLVDAAGGRRRVHQDDGVQRVRSRSSSEWSSRATLHASRSSCEVLFVLWMGITWGAVCPRGYHHVRRSLRFLSSSREVLRVSWVIVVRGTACPLNGHHMRRCVSLGLSSREALAACPLVLTWGAACLLGHLHAGLCHHHHRPVSPTCPVSTMQELDISSCQTDF